MSHDVKKFFGLLLGSLLENSKERCFRRVGRMASVAFRQQDHGRLRAELQAAHDASSLPEPTRDETHAALYDLLVWVRVKGFN